MPPTRSARDRQPIVANRYKLVRKLGTGNFGTAFLCQDRKSNDQLKVLKEVFIGNLKPSESLSAENEAKLLSKLDHPGIVKFYDSFVDDEFFCIVTEYCEGGDLGQKINEFKEAGETFSENDVLNWIVQLLLAAEYIHSRRVLHRDLKTRNIFIRNNMLKIGDFGISRILMGTADLASTFTGTPYYMSPEVLKHEGYNSKSDVWSIGCILFELCKLEHAFTGQGLMGVMYSIVDKEPPDLPPQYSRELNELFKKMLIKDPEKRPSASEILKFPLVMQHIAKMQETLTTDAFKAKENESPERANREATEIANLVCRNDRTQEQFSAAAASPVQAGKSPEKKQTARERMRQKKMLESEKRAMVLK